MDVGHNSDEQANNIGRVINPDTGEVVEGASHNTDEEVQNRGSFRLPGAARVGPPSQYDNKEPEK